MLIVGDGIARVSGLDRCVAGELLHDEALAAEETGADFFLEVDGEIHAGRRGEKRALLRDNGHVRRDLHGTDRAREAGGKGDHAGAALGGIGILEKALAAEHPAKRFSKSAGLCLHAHVGAHPHHGAALGDHALARFQMADDNGHRLALNVVLHVVSPLWFLFFLQETPPSALRLPAPLLGGAR